MTSLFSMGDHLFCRMQVNGRQAVMLFDTGASISHIAPEFAAGCPIIGKARMGGQTGALSDYVYLKQIPDCECDGVEIQRHGFIIDTNIRTHYPDCDGILGMDLLSQKALQIDLDKLHFNMCDESLSSGTAFRLHKGKIFFDVLINGQLVEWVVFDTGAHGLAIEKNLKNRLMLHQLDNDPKHEIFDASGREVPFETYVFNSIVLGQMQWHDFKGYGYCFQRSRQLKKINQQGIIGAPVFSGCSLTFDFSNRLAAIQLSSRYSQ